MLISTVVAAVLAPSLVFGTPPLNTSELRGAATCGQRGNGAGCSVSAGVEHGSGLSSGSTSSASGSRRGSTVVMTARSTCSRERDAAGDRSALFSCSGRSLSSSSSAQPSAPVVDPRTVAEQARASMTLPALTIGSSPATNTPTVIRFPLWLWVDASSWEPVSATASVSTGSITVTATPTTARWDMGDGSMVTCSGPGTVFAPNHHDADASSPDCGHTYTRASATELGGRFPVAVEVSWSVGWSSTSGGGGSLDDLTTRANSSVRVTEVHALVSES